MKIMICGIPHKVLEVDNAFNTDAHFGQIDYADAVIKINAGMPPELKKATLFHEVLHGWLAHLGYCDLTQDEKFVSSLSNAIYQSCDFKEGGAAD